MTGRASAAAQSMDEALAAKFAALSENVRISGLHKETWLGHIPAADRPPKTDEGARIRQAQIQAWLQDPRVEAVIGDSWTVQVTLRGGDQARKVFEMNYTPPGGLLPTERVRSPKDITAAVQKRVRMAKAHLAAA
mmetsp:Transcript_25502/g.71326  ORF Transcript_25502/g.71326 Transcript_25502/m.71326 type:complete len:135 (-) Transcript_25502:445-849(-)